MSDGGKGSGRRPQAVSDEQVANNWDKIFGKNPADVIHDEVAVAISRSNAETQEALAQGKSVPISEIPELQELVGRGLADGTLFLS